MDWHDQQDLAKYRCRKRKQGDYQQAYRERLAKAKTPELDDVAAELKRVFLATVAVDRHKVSELGKMLFDGLEGRGYDRVASVDEHYAMIEMARNRGSAKAATELITRHILEWEPLFTEALTRVHGRSAAGC